MHREIQIKQFRIVTTHWWPKTRNERFCVRKRTVFISFFTSVHNHVQVIWVRTHIRCVTCVCARSGSRCIHTGRRRQRLTEGVVWSVVLTRRHSYNNQSHTSRDWVFAWGDLIGWCLRWRLKSCVSTTLQTRPPSSVDANEPERARTRHTPDVCALRSLGHGCVQEVKNNINTVRFLTQTARSCLRPSMCSYYGELFNWISLCMFFFPLIETVTYTCHYMTDRLERFDLKTSKLDLLKKKRHLHLGCPWGKLIDTKF